MSLPAGSGAPIDLTLPQSTTQQQQVPAWAREESPTWFTPGNTFSIIFFILGLFGSICQFYTSDDGWCTQRASMGTTLPGFVGAAFISLVDRNTDGGDVRNRSWSARWEQLLSRKWFTPGNTVCILAAVLGFFGTICQFYTDEDGWCSARAAMWTGIPGFVGAAVTAIIDRTTDGGDERNRSWSARGRQFARIQRACGDGCIHFRLPQTLPT
ncbi:hypothetical protein FB45DRAFT_933528 [Roridomyces roridus]|uniref:Uncharacterized protein n=1 Tax=Roridomyces roridus TaxID=1738132 RepID=A0AAD7FD87_9AGAR|nr:hypothetical protein FB45DRAFT_933528 [Roridomyces roridus]